MEVGGKFDKGFTQLADTLASLRVKIQDSEKLLAVLNTQRDAILRDLSDASNSLLEVDKRKIELEEKIESLQKQLTDFIVFSGSIVNGCIEQIREAAKVLDSHIKVINKISEKIEIESKKLDGIIANQEQIHKNIVQETKRLDVMRADLEVYRNRIEKKHLELFNQPLIL